MRHQLFALWAMSLLLATGAQAASSADTGHRVIRADYRQVRGSLDTAFRECVGAGRANEGLRADWQQQLAMVREEAGFEYIRMHGLLHDDMGVFRFNERGEPEYNFQYIDRLYDFILSIGMKPFVELGFMPSALASGDQTIFWWRGNVTPPADYRQWEALIRELTRHFEKRYGKEEVASWYFEVWNEPNLQAFWTGSQDDYFRLYARSAAAIKGVNPAFRVGGPATAGAAWVPEMIQYCAENRVPLDFISTHTYGVKQGFVDEFGNTGTVLDANPRSVSGDVLQSRRQIAASSMPELELHYTEWSSSYTPSDPIHDSYHQAAYILQKLKQVDGAADSMSYWVFTDIFEEAGPRFTPFHGGFGLLNYQGIRKPAFFAYAMLNRLGKTELANDDPASWITRNADGDVQVLFWDFTDTHAGTEVNNQDYYVRDLPARALPETDIRLANIPEGRYRLEIRQVGYKVNDPYADYLAMGRPRQLTNAQVDSIKTRNDGAPVAVETLTVDASGQFVRKQPMRENDVFLYSLTRLGD